MPMIYFDIEIVPDFNWSMDQDKLARKYESDMNFMPEFNKILTISVGMRVKDNPDPYIRAFEWPEEEQIEKFFKASENHDVCWWNIIAFDLPFILRRALKHGIKIPEKFKLYGKKPWDMEHIIDLKNVYKHLAPRAASLWDVCDFLWIPTPKDAMDGSEVAKYHQEGKDDEIRLYCKKDVEATIRVAEKMRSLNYM